MNDLQDMLMEFQATLRSELMKQVYVEEQQDRRRELLADREQSPEVQ